MSGVRCQHADAGERALALDRADGLVALRAADAAGRAERAAGRTAPDDDLTAAEQDRRGALRLEAEPEGVAVRLRSPSPVESVSRASCIFYTL